jgi:ribosomal protein S18 acetylase RimI-like enzyme
MSKNKNKIIIERGSLNDIEEIVSLNFAIFKGMYEDDPYSLAQYRDKLKNREPIIFIAKKDGKIVGDSISFEKDGYFYLWIFGVDKKYRRAGLGTLLLGENERFAKENNYESIRAKVYNVSQEMQELLKKRDYYIVEVEESKIDIKYTALKFELKFKP